MICHVVSVIPLKVTDVLEEKLPQDNKTDDNNKKKEIVISTI